MEKNAVQYKWAISTRKKGSTHTKWGKAHKGSHAENSQMYNLVAARHQRGTLVMEEGLYYQKPYNFA